MKSLNIAFIDLTIIGIHRIIRAMARIIEKRFWEKNTRECRTLWASSFWKLPVAGEYEKEYVSVLFLKLPLFEMNLL